VDGSPAARAGIAVGDVLRSVNGRAISGASIDWVAEVLTQAGATHSLRVEREVPLALR
jgi:S1-C subfamily serine protease